MRRSADLLAPRLPIARRSAIGSRAKWWPPTPKRSPSATISDRPSTSVKTGRFDLTNEAGIGLQRLGFDAVTRGERPVGREVERRRKRRNGRAGCRRAPLLGRARRASRSARYRSPHGGRSRAPLCGLGSSTTGAGSGNAPPATTTSPDTPRRDWRARLGRRCPRSGGAPRYPLKAAQRQHPRCRRRGPALQQGIRSGGRGQTAPHRALPCRDR